MVFGISNQKLFKSVKENINWYKDDWKQASVCPRKEWVDSVQHCERGSSEAEALRGNKSRKTHKKYFSHLIFGLHISLLLLLLDYVDCQLKKL